MAQHALAYNHKVCCKREYRCSVIMHTMRSAVTCKRFAVVQLRRRARGETCTNCYKYTVREGHVVPPNSLGEPSISATWSPLTKPGLLRKMLQREELLMFRAFMP